MSLEDSDMGACVPRRMRADVGIRPNFPISDISCDIAWMGGVQRHSMAYGTYIP